MWRRRWRPTTPARAAWLGGAPSGPGLPRDEFIDDIPFPETQNYVKRIIGTAEDYRRAVRRAGRVAATGARIVPAEPALGAHDPAPHVPEGVAVHRVGHPRDDAPGAGARRGQPVAGVSRLSRARRRSRQAACDAIRGRRQPVRRDLGREGAARGHRRATWPAAVRRDDRPGSPGHRVLRRRPRP